MFIFTRLSKNEVLVSLILNSIVLIGIGIITKPIKVQEPILNCTNTIPLVELLIRRSLERCYSTRN